MNYKPLLAMLFSISLVFSPVLVHADELPTDATTPVPVTTSTSTEPLLTPPLPVTSTTSSVAVVATTTVSILSSPSSTAPVTLPPTASAPPVTLPVTPSSTATSTMLCLAIIEPAPLQGLEWVAFYGLTPSTTDALLNWTLADAQGSLLKFSHTSTLLWDETSKTIRIELKSSRLNNDGDTVTLKNPLNEKHDEFVYPGVEKGERWMRDSCLSPWHRFPERVVSTPAVTVPVPTPSASSASTTSPEVTTSSSTGTTVTLPADEEPTMTVTSQSLPASPTPVSEESPSTETIPSVETSTEEPSTFFLAVPPAATVQEEVTQALAAEVVPAKSSPALPAESVTTQNASAKATKKVSTKPSTTKTTSSPKDVAKKSATKPTTKKAPVKKSVTVKKPKASTAVSKSVPSISSFSMSPLLADPETFQGIRVRVIGRVASEKDLLGTHRYVIVNEDGRGLIIHANSKQLSPALGSLIEVTGTVVWNDEGLWLKQTTTDLWQNASSSNQLSYAQLPKRSVNLVSPSQEDAWSLVTTEGVVSAVQKSSFDIDVDGIVVRVKISSKLGYRAARLQAGDQVRVQGLLDTRQGEPILVPQSVEAIEILGRASVAHPTAKAPVTHPWLPVGAAAGTLGLSESWRRFRDRQKRRREEASFKALVSPSLREE